MVFLGSITKTERMVNAIPLESTLVVSWWSNLYIMSIEEPGSGGEEGGSHVIKVCNLALLVANNWEFQGAAGDLIDILDPSSVGLDSVGRQTDQLGVALGELGLEFGEGTELGGADGSIILRVGEENNPAVANELMEVNGTVGGLGLEVRGD